MHRVLVALLSTVDAVVSALVGLAAAFAPLAVLWAFGFSGGAPWGALWPAGATVWQAGNLVPLQVTLPDEYLQIAGIDPAAASFAFSLAPLAFAVFTVTFAVRSGARAVRASAWVTGVVSGALVFAVIATFVSLLGANAVARAEPIAAIAIPAALYALSALTGAMVTAWRHGDDGIVDRVHAAARRWPVPWGSVPGLVVRGFLLVLTGLVGAGAAVLGIAILGNAGEIVALYEAGHATVLGATMLTVGQLAYLPTLVVWALSWLCGPGFALGTATAVSPAGTQLGVVPALPVLGAVPESASPWLLLVLLVPVAVAALAGVSLRGRIDESHAVARAVTVLSASVLCALAAAGLAAAASGALGPGRLADVGPPAGPLALAVGVEVLVGLALGVFSPAVRRGGRSRGVARDTREAAGAGDAPDTPQADAGGAPHAPQLPGALGTEGRGNRVSSDAPAPPVD